MNIAIVIDSLVGGGAEKVMLTLAEKMAKLHHNITILSLASSVEYDIPDNMYVMENESINAILDSDTGWIVKRFGDSMPENILTDLRSDKQESDELIRAGVKVTYLGIYSDYEVYRWIKE